jgi:hypothetical protein
MILCICRAYAFLEAREVPPDVGPPTMVLISPTGQACCFQFAPFGLVVSLDECLSGG